MGELNTDAIAEEFDHEVEKRCAAIARNAENTAKNMKNTLEICLLSIPKSVRDMSMKLLIEQYGGDIAKAAASKATRSMPRPQSPKRKALGTSLASASKSQTMSLSDLLKKKGASTPTPKRTNRPPLPPSPKAKRPIPLRV